MCILFNNHNEEFKIVFHSFINIIKITMFSTCFLNKILVLLVLINVDLINSLISLTRWFFYTFLYLKT